MTQDINRSSVILSAARLDFRKSDSLSLVDHPLQSEEVKHGKKDVKENSRRRKSYGAYAINPETIKEESELALDVETSWRKQRAGSGTESVCSMESTDSDREMRTAAQKRSKFSSASSRFSLGELNEDDIKRIVQSKIRSNSISIASMGHGLPKPGSSLLKSVLFNRAVSHDPKRTEDGSFSLRQRAGSGTDTSLYQGSSFDNPIFDEDNVDFTSITVAGVTEDSSTDDDPHPKRTLRISSLDSIGEFDGITQHLERVKKQSPLTFDIQEGPEENNEEFKHKNDILKRRIMKNVILVSVAFLCLFSCISSLAALQSSLNVDGALGVIGMCVNFLTVVVSCIFTPHLLIRFMGYKWSMTISMIGTIPWIMANVYPRWVTIIPGSILLGISWAPMWTAHSSYVTLLAKKYSRITKMNQEEAVTKFFSIFYMMFLSTPIWGNLIAGAILGNDSTAPYCNGSDIEQGEVLSFCGAKFCPLWELADENITNTNLERPSNTQVTTLVLINVAIMVTGILLVAVFADKLTVLMGRGDTRIPEAETDSLLDAKLNIRQLMIATARQACRRKQLFIMPFTIYTGLQQAFLLAEFTGAYVACALGIGHVSYTAIVFGLVGALISIGLEPLAKRIGRLPVFISAAVLQFVALVFLLEWQPEPCHLHLFYIIPAIWGIGDAIFQSGITALYGTMFCDSSEAAFANYRMWESVGFIIGYSSSAFICVSEKIYILLCLLVFAVICYIVCELLIYRKKNIQNVS